AGSLQQVLRLFCPLDRSECTESRIPPLRMRPSYRFASYSGIPIPTSAPATPPTAPPTPIPASVATSGPAAMNGPSPGIASAPMPPSQLAGGPADRGSRARPGSRALGCLGPFRRGKVLRALVVRHEDGDVGIAETCRSQLGDRLLHLGDGRVDSKNSRVLS